MIKSNISKLQLLSLSPSELEPYLSPDSTLDARWLGEYVAYHQKVARQTLAEELSELFEEVLLSLYTDVETCSPRSRAGKKTKVARIKLNHSTIVEHLEACNFIKAAALLKQNGVD